jgi:TolA-binding protein
MRARFSPAGFVALACAALSGCGFFAMQTDHEALVAKVKEQDKAQEERMKELAADLAATRDRLDNALRANADNGSDLMGEKARMNELAGRTDEVAHSVDELKANLAAARTELDGRIDALKRAQDAQPIPAPPPVPIPTDKAQHYTAIEAANGAKDWPLLRTLGHEYVNRYATDERAADVLYMMGSADLVDDRPSSALGEFNRLLKLFPRSSVLGKALFGMGEAYYAIHDCENAKLAFQTCASRFAREKIATEARRRVLAIEKAPAGTCAPP